MTKKEPSSRAARQRFQYAAKFLCTANIPGSSPTTSLLPGVYQTAVNIHNPIRQAVGVRIKLAIADGEVTKKIGRELRSDEATKVDCSDIPEFGILPVHGVEGFLVIESVRSLDVIAVYTASKQGGDVESIAVEHVPERRLA